MNHLFCVTSEYYNTNFVRYSYESTNRLLLERMWVLVGIFTVLFSYVIVKTVESWRYWKKRGIAHLKPWPLIGNFGSLIFKKKNLAHLVEDHYKSFPNKRYFGMHQLTFPTLVITDLELIKRITVKDFEHFMDHTTMIDTEIEPLFQKNLFLLCGQEWKRMRAILSPSFTGIKIRSMFTLMVECAKQFNEHFLARNEDTVEVEMKELMSRYANDVIATCGFGVQCNSVNDKDSDFYKMANTVTKTSISVWIKSMVQVAFPALAKRLKISIIAKDVSSFFENAILETMRVRKEKNIIRPDMIHLLMEAMKGKDAAEHQSKDIDAGFAAVDDFLNDGQKFDETKSELTTDDIIAQAFLFFLAGFETVSVLLSHCLHELAVNPDVQERLQREIDSEFQKTNGGDLGYETVANMKYLDMVVSETLRKWPPAVMLNRLCVKDFLIDGDERCDEKPLLLEKGLSILIPVYGIQRDPKYYAEPDRFDPERFSDENRDKLVPYSYLPFGTGPRNCIGSRFALLEAKTLVTYILSKFTLVPTTKTEIPLKLSPTAGSPCPKGFWLGLKKRQKIEDT